MIVPFVPGGSSDITARSVTPALSKLLGQTFVVENKPGANSAIGAQALARSTPDGYTMMVGSIGTFAINEALYKNLSYNPSKDFEYLTQAVRNPNVLVAANSFPASTVAELVDYAKKHPGSVSYASSGTGSSDHLSAVLFRQRTGSTGVDVPYKGGGAAIADLIGGQVNVSFQNLGAVQNHIKAGKLKALAITGDARARDLPDVPTLSEAGIKDMVVYSWQGFAVPKGTRRRSCSNCRRRCRPRCATRRPSRRCKAWASKSSRIRRNSSRHSSKARSSAGRTSSRRPTSSWNSRRQARQETRKGGACGHPLCGFQGRIK